ncbi:MAG: phosphocholine cytidylyltransferase family protein [Planctomycetota bacterium]
MARTSAVILAAGKGSRLGAWSDGLPKCLVQVGGRTMVEHQLESLADTGVHPVTMVIGHGSDLVREAVNGRAEYVLNPRYASTNSLYSLWLARENLRGPLLILNCDVLFHAEVLNRVLSEGPDVIAYDTSSGKGLEQTKVELSEGRLTRLSKDLPAEKSSGESLGIVYLSEKGTETLLECADELIGDGKENSWVIEALEETARRTPIRAVDVAGLPWVEIDFPYDLDRARREVWPKISRPVRSRRALPVTLMLALFLATMAVILFRGKVLSYEDLAIDGGTRVAILQKGNPVDWYMLDNGDVAQMRVESEGMVRIDLRMVLNEKKRLPYVVEVCCDGVLVDWYKYWSTPSTKASYRDWIIGDRDSIDLELIPGTHTLQVRLIGGPSNRLLVRFRQPEQQERTE